MRVDTVNPVESLTSPRSKMSNGFYEWTQFKYLKYKNNIGTDLTIELPLDHVFG